MRFFKLLFITLFSILLSNTSFADYRYRYKAEGSILGQFDNKNLPPLINTSIIDNAFKDSPYSFVIDGLDPNGDILLWSWSGDTIPNTNINVLTGEISGTPNTSGDYTFTVLLDDQNGGVVSKQFTVSVLDCTTGPIGTECADGAIYIGDSSGRVYMAPNDLSERKSWGLKGFDVSGTPIASAMNYNLGSTITNAMTPAYDSYNDGTRIGTAAMDCRNELGSEWYLPSVPEIELIVNNDSVPSSGTLKTNGNIQNSTYLASSPVNNTNHMSYRFFSSSAYILARNSIGYVRCFRK